MDWIRDNKFLAGYVAIFVIVGGLLAFLMISARSAYKDTIADYESTSQLVTRLSGKDLYPNKKTLDRLQTEAGEMRAAVNKLQGQMLEYTRPLDATMTGGGFQQKLTQLVVALKKRSVLEAIELEDEFSLGLTKYTAELPNEKAVPDLNFHLDALDYLANSLFDAEVDSIEVFDRIPLSIEGGDRTEKEQSDKNGGDEAERNEEAANYVARYPVRICFKGRPGTLETFVNKISNAPKEDFIFNIRYVTIENSSDEGPQKEVDFDVGVRSSEGIESEPGEESPSGFSDATDESDGAGVVDSRVVLGKETLEVCLVVEAIRIEAIPSSEDGDDLTSE